MRSPLRAAAIAGVLAASVALPQAQPDRASEILARAREAIGGEARLRAVHSLSMKANARMIGSSVVVTWSPDGIPSTARADDLETRATVKLDVLLPERYLVSVEQGDATRSYGFDGDRLRFDRSRGIPRMVLADPAQMSRMAMLQRREFMRYVTAFLLVPPERFAMQFADAGQADTESGPADVLDATGAYQFAARFYFHTDTHRLLMITAQEPPAPRRNTNPSNPAEAGSREQGAGRTDKQGASEQNVQKPEPFFKSLEGPLESGVSLQIRFDDFRIVDGIALPHRIVSDIGRIDDWQVTKFKVNPEIDPKRFRN